jgi:hypothetical protein
MARKDDLLVSFLQHDILKKEEYGLEADNIPQTVREALKSNLPIVKAIALIVDNLEAAQPSTDATLRTIITTYLNEASV